LKVEGEDVTMGRGTPGGLESKGRK
jgi:hypothetical protein